MEESWTEELSNFLGDFMEGAVSTYTVAGAALAVGVTALAF